VRVAIPGSPPDLAAALSHLTALGRALSGAMRSDAIAGHAAAALQGLFAAKAVTVVLEQQPGSPFVVAASRGAPEETLDSPFLEECLHGRQVVRRAGPPRLGAPLLAAGQVVGVLVLEGAPDAEYGVADEQILDAAATQVSLALQNARLLALLSFGKREWEQIVDAFGSAVCIVDYRGAVRRANRTFAALVDTPVTAIAGRPWRKLLREEWLEPVERLLEDASGAPCELRDDHRVFVASTILIGGDDPEARAAVLVLDDHTERRRLQDQLIQSEKMSAVGQLISGVAHELNNPLASVLGFADYLVENSEIPPALAEPLKVIQQEALRAAGIVKNLLTFGRRQDQERRPLAVGEVIERTAALLKNQLIQQNVTLVVEIADGLPDVHGSPNQLQQVFVNLVNNAAQAIAGTGQAGTVTVRARPWLDGVAIDVADTGPGVPPSLAERVFEPFFSTKREGEGTGLGLAICQGLVKEHGGRLSLQPARGAGATFTVELPAARGAITRRTTEPSEAPASARVLVVDDEHHILRYMRATLESWGHQVDTAADGSDGLRSALSGNHDIIFTDVRMPGVGGREFFEALRAEAPGIASRVVFATGDTVADDTLAFLKSTGRPVLTKPFRLAELRATLAAALAHR
jgi:two-component system NtrC family sensor kinase